MAALTELVADLRGGERPAVRRKAADALGALRAVQAVNDLVSALDDDFPAVREAAAGALVRLGEPALVPLVAALNHQSHRARLQAAHALGRLGDPRAAEPLADALVNDRSLRESAATALVQLGEPALAPLLAALKHQSYRVRSLAAHALGRLGDPRAAGTLRELLEDDHPSVRSAAADALTKLDKPAIDPSAKDDVEAEAAAVGSETSLAWGCGCVVVTLALLGLLAFGGAKAYNLLSRWAAEEAAKSEALARKSQAIIEDIRKQRSSCKSNQTSDDVLPRQPRVLVWDMETDSKSRIHDRLPDWLKMRQEDRVVTVVMVLGRRQEQVGRYSVSGAPAYVKYVDVCLVDWPTRTVLGQTAVTGSSPREVRPVQQQGEAGESEQAVADWIARLPG